MSICPTCGAHATHSSRATLERREIRVKAQAARAQSANLRRQVVELQTRSAQSRRDRQS